LFDQTWVLSPKDDLCHAWLKLAQWFWRTRFLNDPTPFSHFCDSLPFEKELILNLKKLEFPSSKDNFYQVWLKLACWFWRSFLFIFTLLPLSPLGQGVSSKGYPLHLNKLESPPSKDDLCQVWLKLSMWFWRRTWKCKSIQTDAGQWVIRKAHLSFHLR
jgi:hypothetical protein